MIERGSKEEKPINITDALRGEHGVYYAQFAHLEQAVPLLKELASLKAQTAMLAPAPATHAQLEVGWDICSDTSACRTSTCWWPDP